MPTLTLLLSGTSLGEPSCSPGSEEPEPRAKPSQRTSLEEHKEVPGFKQGEIILKHTCLVYCLALELPHRKVYASESLEDWIA